jgi:hypothetical protein
VGATTVLPTDTSGRKRGRTINRFKENTTAAILMMMMMIIITEQKIFNQGALVGLYKAGTSTKIFGCMKNSEHPFACRVYYQPPKKLMSRKQRSSEADSRSAGKAILHRQSNLKLHFCFVKNSLVQLNIAV